MFLLFYFFLLFFFFFFSSRRRHTRWPRDWSSDVCSSDLLLVSGFALPLGSARAQSTMAPAANITFFDSSSVAAAFAKGKPLLEVEAYKIHASRRETPGQAEVHTRDTDVIYVLRGHALFITGGAAKALHTVAPD